MYITCNYNIPIGTWRLHYTQVSAHFLFAQGHKCIFLFILSSCDSTVSLMNLCAELEQCLCVYVCVCCWSIPSSSLHVRLVTVLLRTTSHCETMTPTSSWTKETWRWPMVTQPSQPMGPRPPPVPKDWGAAGVWTANAATAHQRMRWSEN